MKIFSPNIYGGKFTDANVERVDVKSQERQKQESRVILYANDIVLEHFQMKIVRSGMQERKQGQCYIRNNKSVICNDH